MNSTSSISSLMARGGDGGSPNNKGYGNSNSTSSLMTRVKSDEDKVGGDPNVTISGGGFGDNVGTNLNRAYAWFVAGIVASVIVSILLVIAMYVFGFAPNLSAVLGHSPLKAGLVFIAALVIGFATAGSVYEGWVGCKV